MGSSAAANGRSGGTSRNRKRGGKGGGKSGGTSSGRSGPTVQAPHGGTARVDDGELPTPRVLREYALVADGERGAVIGPDGSVAWLCAPRWDSPAVFSGLLGGAGRYTVAPADPWHVWGGYYEPGTLIWRSRWVGGGPDAGREAPP